MCESSCDSTSLSAFDVVSVSDFSVSRWCVLVCAIVLMCSSLMTYDVEHLFIRLCDICVSSLVRCLSRSAAHFLIGLFTFSLLSFKNSLYILDVSPLSDKCFANTFSRSVASLFILLTVPFTQQKFLIFKKSSSSNFSFMYHAFGIISKNSLPR